MGMMKTLLLLIVISLQLLMSGCTFIKMLEHGTMKEPTLEYQDYEIADIGLDKVSLRLFFKAINPNKQNIDTFFTDYEVFIGDKSVVEGKDLRITLIPEGESTVMVPVELIYSQLFETAGTLAKMLSEGKRKVDTRVHIHIHGEFLIYEFLGKRHTREYSYRVNVDTELPLPEVTVEKVTKAVKGSINNFLGFTIFEDNAGQAMVELQSTDKQGRFFYDFTYFEFDTAYDTTRMKQMLPNIEDYDDIIYPPNDL